MISVSWVCVLAAQLKGKVTLSISKHYISGGRITLSVNDKSNSKNEYIVTGTFKLIKNFRASCNAQMGEC